MRPGLLAVPVALLLAGCTGAGEVEEWQEPSSSTTSSASAAERSASSESSRESAGMSSGAAKDRSPRWRVKTVAAGLDHPWALVELPDGTALVTERAGGVSLLEDGEVRRVVQGPADLYATGEGGLMGIELSPAFARDRRFFLCYASTAGDVRVVPWRLAADAGSATELEPLVTGLTLNPSGRHSGCRLRIGADDALWIGAGDSAVGTNPQDLSALGGKVLRVDPDSGEPSADNPLVDDPDPASRLLYTWGHRNVQGLAVRPETGEMYSAEHGPDVDDEVNLLQPGGNYGWDPVGSGTYDESVPMTDPEIDGAVPAVWSSGDPTLAVSGIAFLGREWGPAAGLLAVAALKASSLYLLDVDSGELRRAPVLDGDQGRLRAVAPSADGSLYVLTDNGGDDRILRLSP